MRARHRAPSSGRADMTRCRRTGPVPPGEGGTGGLSPAGLLAPGHHVIGSASKPVVAVSENHPA